MRDFCTLLSILFGAYERLERFATWWLENRGLGPAAQHEPQSYLDPYNTICTGARYDVLGHHFTYYWGKGFPISGFP